MTLNDCYGSRENKDGGYMSQTIRYRYEVTKMLYVP